MTELHRIGPAATFALAVLLITLTMNTPVVAHDSPQTPVAGKEHELLKQDVGTWVDTMNPHLMTTKGDYDPETKTYNMVGEGRDPMTGKMKKSKHVGRYIDDNTRTFEIHEPGEDGTFWKMLELNYKRRME